MLAKVVIGSVKMNLKINKFLIDLQPRGFFVKPKEKEGTAHPQSPVTSANYFRSLL